MLVESLPAHRSQLGTGLGLWPTSQSVEWPNTTFIGLDLVPCQTNLSILAEAERAARSTSRGPAPASAWERIEERVTWETGDLQVLQYPAHR